MAATHAPWALMADKRDKRGRCKIFIKREARAAKELNRPHSRIARVNSTDDSGRDSINRAAPATIRKLISVSEQAP
jgi:hypothetical protein